MIFHTPCCMEGTFMTENGLKKGKQQNVQNHRGCAGEEEKTDQVIQIALC